MLRKSEPVISKALKARLTLARPPLASHLDIIKFICKDLFLFVYSKQVDNLRTNHRGVFVLQSHVFPPLVALSSRGPADLDAAKRVNLTMEMGLTCKHLVFPQALIQGALARLGMNATVVLESTGLPQCKWPSLHLAHLRYISDTCHLSYPLFVSLYKFLYNDLLYLCLAMQSDPMLCKISGPRPFDEYHLSLPLVKVIPDHQLMSVAS